jgi:hypothetical protein
MKNAAKWLIALVAVATMWQLAYRRGVIEGEHGVDYWQGWQDAMTETDYGNKPLHKQ